MVDEFGEEGYTDAAVPALSFGPEKVIAEAAMLAYAATGATDSERVRSRVEGLVVRLVPVTRSARALAELSLQPSRAFKYAVPHVLLTRLGRPAPEPVEECFQSACRRAASLWSDLPTSAELERDWITRLWGWNAAGRTSRGPFFGEPLDVLSDTREDTYAFTHQLFYLTDFGRSPRLALARPVAELLADAEALVVRYLDAEDYDLVGELLMSWPELAMPWSPVSGFALRVLAHVEDQVGVLPCGNLDADRLNRLSRDEGRRYARAVGYHTAFVMGFLAAVTLRAGNPPVSRSAGVVPSGPNRSRAWAHIVQDQGHWQDVFAQVPDSEKAGLEPVLTRLATAQRLRLHDYAGLAAVLNLQAADGGLDPLGQAASDRLSRVDSAMQASGRG